MILFLFNFRYAREVDVDFVRKSVRAIGRCAIKVAAAADRYAIQIICKSLRSFSVFNF